MKTKAELKDRLKALRNEKNISAAMLAEVLSKGKSTLGMWETGKANPDIPTLIEIADYFDVSIDYLLGRSPYKNCKEESELNQSADRDEAISHYGIGVYRKLKAFMNSIEEFNKFHGVTRFDKALLGGFPFIHASHIVSAYHNAFESAANSSCTTGKAEGVIIEEFLHDIRGADKSGAFIKALLEEMGK